MMKLLSPLLLALCVATSASAEEANLIKNGNFAQWTEGKPASWNAAPGQTVSEVTNASAAGTTTALKVEIAKDGGKSLGEIRQVVKDISGVRFRLEGMVQSTEPGLCLLMVKLRRNQQELKRISSKEVSSTEWTVAALEFAIDNADEVQILCRYKQSDKFVGKTGSFTNLKLTKIE